VVYADLQRSALFLNFHWGKTLRDGSKHLVRVERGAPGSAACPVIAVSNWVAAARQAGWVLDGGYLFSPIDALDAARGEGPGAQAEANARFVGYLQRWSMWAGETLHGLRGGGAVAHVFSVADQLTRAAAMRETQARVGWAGSGMMEHYTAMELMQVAAGARVLRCPEEYDALDRLPMRAEGEERRAYFL
jgi:hypothetical protein